MIRNVYFKCDLCGDIITKYMDDKYINDALTNLSCHNCGGKNFIETKNDDVKPIKVKNRVRDNRAIDKEKYMSNEYKDIRKEINRIHRERKGVLGDKRIFA